VSKLNFVLFLALFAAIVAISGIHGSWIEALSSLLLLTVFLFSGVLISSFLLKDRHLAWVFAFPVGYVFHSVVLALIVRVAGMHPAVIVTYLIVTILLLVLRRKTFLRLQISWSQGDVSLLLIWLLLSAAVVAWPLIHVGAKIEEGYAFRAYFNADYFKHLGMTGTLSHTGIPPLNSYLSGHTLHYYWLFYVIPAFWTRLFSTYTAQYLIIQFTVVGALMFVATLYATLHYLTKSRAVLALLLPVFLLGGSYEGLYAIDYLQSKNFPMSRFTMLNIDGLTRWFWQTPQIDTMYRALLYAPQHLLAVSIALLALLNRRENSTRSTRIAAMAFLFSTLGFAAIIGAVLIAGSIFLVTIDFIRKPREKFPEFVIIGLTGCLFLLFYFPVTRMFRIGPEEEWIFGLVDTVWKTFPRYFLLNFGALLILGMAGVLLSPRGFPARFCIFFLVVCLLCMQLIQNRMGGSEVTLKLGYICNVALLILTAGLFARMRHRLALLWIVVLVTVLPASVGWVMDLYNSQDIRNRAFVTIVPLEDAEVYEWMKENLAPDSVTQHNSNARETLRVTPIPSFAQRGVYVGDLFHGRAFQVEEEEFVRRQEVVWALFHQNSKQAHALAVQEKIQYVFISARDTEIPEARYRFVNPYFSTLFQNGNALLVRVNETVTDEGFEDADVLIRTDKGTPVLKGAYQRGFYQPEPLRKEIVRWMREEGLILVESREPMRGELAFALSSFQRSRNVEIRWNNSVVLAKEITEGRTDLVVPVQVQAGRNELVIRSLDGTADAQGRNVSVRISGLRFTRK
jgi:hypothetical protein